MDIKKKSHQVIEETNLGIYVWEMPDGRWIGDEDGNFLSVAARKGDKVKMDMIAREVKSYGIYVGQPKFLSGRRKIDDEEFEYQRQRLEWGLVPDPLDIGVYKEEMAKARKQ